MGNDGGTIPSRKEILNLYSNKSSKNATSAKDLTLMKTASSFKFCRISKKKLAKPIMSDYKGYLYNKESILEYLLEAKLDAEFSHITSLKDLVELDLDYDDTTDTLKCTLTGLSFDLSKETGVQLPVFCYISPCGCSMTKKMLNELVSIERKDKKNSSYIEMKCPLCTKLFNTRDIIDINPIDEEAITRLETRMSQIKAEGLTHSLKASKKTKKKKLRPISPDDEPKNKKRVKTQPKNVQ